MADYIGRFAPSPTGDLHFGSLVAALASYLDARHHQGQWLLRIDDIDQFRVDKKATPEILTTLKYFGLQWDGIIRYQNQNINAYQQALTHLEQQNLAYPCVCSRTEIFKLSAAGIYLGTCKDWGIDQTLPHSIRISVAGIIRFTDQLHVQVEQSLSTAVGDFIIKRKDGIFAYQLATVVDDAAQGITHIVRGDDLLDSTPRQIYLQQCLNYPAISYTHIPVVKDKQGIKLSKQSHAKPLDKKHPIETLKQALQFLNQPIPQNITSIPILLQKAIENWQIKSIKYE